MKGSKHAPESEVGGERGAPRREKGKREQQDIRELDEGIADRDLQRLRLSDNRKAAEVLEHILSNQRKMIELETTEPVGKAKTLMSCLVVKINADRLLIDTRESDVDKKGTVVYGWDAIWAGTEGLVGSEKGLGHTWLREAKSYYDRAKEARIEREKERGDHRIMRECRGLLKLIGTAYGVGSVQDKRELEAERKRREKEEVTVREKTDSLKATTAAKRREEEATRWVQEKEAMADMAVEDQKVKKKVRNQDALMKRTKVDNAKFHLDMTKGTMSVDEMLASVWKK